VIGGAFVSLVGYIILYTQSGPGASYAGTIIAAAGVFPTVAVILAWASSNAGGDLKRGVVLAMVIGLGNLGGCVTFLTDISLSRPHEFTEYAHLSSTLILRGSISAMELSWAG
jgi:hypothetical protein